MIGAIVWHVMCKWQIHRATERHHCTNATMLHDRFIYAISVEWQWRCMALNAMSLEILSPVNDIKIQIRLDKMISECCIGNNTKKKRTQIPSK